MRLIMFMHFFSLALGAAPKTNEVSPDRPRVMLQEIQFQKDQKRVIVPVRVTPKIQSQVSAEVEGMVVKILKPLGASVRAGDIILYLENKDPGFTYAQVPVTSPVTGVLSQIWISQMTKVNRGDKLFEVINPKSLRLTGEVPSGDLAHVKMGMLGTYSMEPYKTNEYSVRILGVSPMLDTRTGTASAEFEFMKSREILPPIGSIGQITLEITKGDILMVPEAALIFREGKPYVRVLKGEHQYVKKNIELGEQRDASYVVRSGITSGEKIIVRSSRTLKEGESIEIEKTASKTQ